VTTVSQGNAYVGVEITTGISVPADAWWAPIETISNSENGFERVYQGSGMLLSWPLSLEPGASWDVRISNTVTVTRDHAAEA
jgi:alpha-amylase